MGVGRTQLTWLIVHLQPLDLFHKKIRYIHLKKPLTIRDPPHYLTIFPKWQALKCKQNEQKALESYKKGLRDLNTDVYVGHFPVIS